MFIDRLAAADRLTRACLAAGLPKHGPMAKPMAHAALGGKGLRGFMVIEGARMHDIPDSASQYAAAAIEAMHACSLAHDDLPCMDDDDLRRGQPTVHVLWGEAMGVLVGDALQSLAFELVADHAVGNAEVRVDLTLSLARGAGGLGMVMGQALDIAAEAAAEPLSLEDIIALQAGKTGALFEWSATAGARLAQADIGPLQTYGRALGLAFQIADDILDIEGDATTVGKAVGKDTGAGKATFVTHLGLAGAKARASDLVTEACEALAPYGDKANSLCDAARFAISRRH